MAGALHAALLGAAALAVFAVASGHVPDVFSPYSPLAEAVRRIFGV